MEYKKINELTAVVTGGTPSTRKNEYWDNGDIPWLQSGCCQNCDVDSTEKYITKEGYNNSSTHMMSADTVMIALTGATAGKVGYLKFEACGNQSITGILPCESLNQRYLFFYLLSQREKILADCVGGAQAHISQSYVKNMTIPILAIKEQEQIVGELTKLSNIVSLRQEEIQQLDNLVKARFVEVFGDININDKNWECEFLGNLCTIVRGGSPRPIEKFLGGDVPWIKIGDATEADNIYLSSTKEHIIKEGVKNSRLVKEGSLIFANCGVSLGFARIITFDGCIHDGWLAMEDIDKRLDKVFLLQALNQMTGHFRAIAPAGTQPNLNTAIMKAYKQVIPPIELQKEFIRFVHQVNKSKFDTMTFAPIYAIINLYLHTHFYQGRR